MSLDIDLMVTKPASVWEYNITHNVNKMAMQVQLGGGLTLYEVLWRPDEHGMKFARDISQHLIRGFETLKADPEYFKKWNPENGWGSYDGLVQFVAQYRNACLDYPDAELRVSR
jgi:hypothetical protein